MPRFLSPAYAIPAIDAPPESLSRILDGLVAYLP